MDIIEEVYDFYQKFDGEKGIIGYTFNGKKIPYIKVAKTLIPKIIIVYSIHAREYITSYLALEQIKNFVRTGQKGTVYFVPMLNIDGVEIALYKNPLYKANARKVDLNVNFDARWGQGKNNIKTPNSENYIGESPFSEYETRAIRDFTYLVNPDITLSYHSKGQEIYWYFSQNEIETKRDKLIAEKLAKTTGYKIKLTPNSAGGYKDWCIDKLKIPAFTIEVGDDFLSHPIGKENLPKIYEENKNVINILTELKCK